MEINVANLYIDAVHRLPSSGRGPRPVIIKFISKLDRDMVWAQKASLCKIGSNISVREHFNEKNERNIRKLLPIRHTAIDQGKKVRLAKDRLTIDSKLYTVDNMYELPPDLSPERLATKTINNNTFFFSANTPLSNFHPSKFEIDGIVYSHGKMFIQATKASMFEDDPTLKIIMSSKSPGEMKALGAKVNNFNKVVWENS